MTKWQKLPHIDTFNIRGQTRK